MLGDAPERGFLWEAVWLPPDTVTAARRTRLPVLLVTPEGRVPEHRSKT